jgi:alkylhydroperoxidase/carboxymuconolactone decarboxylase family protein YurZ
MNAQPAPPLTNVQLELLKVFALGVTDEEVLEIRRMLARYFMQKAVTGATKVWEERGYTAEQLLNEPS